MSFHRKLFALLFFILFIPAIYSQADKEGSGAFGLTWGTTFDEVLNHFRSLAKNPGVKDAISIVNVQPDREILTERKGIKYRFVFYKKPAVVAGESRPEGEGFESMAGADETAGTDDIPPESETESESKKNNNQARLFFMETKFPFVPSHLVFKELKAKYGDPEITSLNKEGAGAYVWRLQYGYLVQWVELYDKKPFTRSLYYLSIDIKKEIEADYQQYRYTREIFTLRNIIP